MFRIDIEIPARLLKAGVALPDCYNTHKVRGILLLCLQFWDKSHKKQKIGKIKNGSKLQCRYPRTNGKIDLVNGTLNEEGTSYNMKYEKEARFMFGMCLDIDEEGEVKKDEQGRELGVWLPLFEYLEQNIVSDEEYWKIFREVMKEPKTFTGDIAKPWIKIPRDPTIRAYMNNPVTNLKGIGTASQRAIIPMTYDVPVEYRSTARTI